MQNKITLQILLNKLSIGCLKMVLSQSYGCFIVFIEYMIKINYNNLIFSKIMFNVTYELKCFIFITS